MLERRLSLVACSRRSNCDVALRLPYPFSLQSEDYPAALTRQTLSGSLLKRIDHSMIILLSPRNLAKLNGRHGSHSVRAARQLTTDYWLLKTA
jgi:hypothetical protein